MMIGGFSEITGSDAISDSCDDLHAEIPPFLETSIHKLGLAKKECWS